MSLITIQRSPTPQDSPDSSSTSQIDDSDGMKSQSEDYFASKATAVLQNQVGRRRSSVIQEGDIIQSGLKKALCLLRKEDSLKLIVNLEKVNSKLEGYRYFCVIVTSGKQDTAEYLILGLDACFNNCTIGLVLPICQDMSVALDGDGGFRVKNKSGEKLFKPTSVHALWITVQLLNKACSIARRHNYYVGGLSHTWIGVYVSQITSNRAQIAEWNRMIDADAITNSNLAPKSAIGEFVIGTHVDESVLNKDEIREHLKDIMRDEDMDTVTVTYLREQLQKKVTFCLKPYREFVAEEICIICGQMDTASEILPYLYLGSTYNACNRVELLAKKITHIINVTRETENFFREEFTYHNVEVFDYDTTELLNVFNDCYQFINLAKSGNSACLVHCQRGISRSATVVIAYMMKEFNWTCDKALAEVKKKRDCVHPNDGFMTQLETYEGMLKARRDFYNLILNENKPNTISQHEKRNKIMSVPNECFPIYDQAVESPTDTNSIPHSYPSAIQYEPTLPCTAVFPSSNAMQTDSSSIVNINTPETMESINSNQKVDIQDHLLMYKTDDMDNNQNDCFFEGDIEDTDLKPVALRGDIPIDCEIMTNPYHTRNSTTISMDIFTSVGVVNRHSADSNANEDVSYKVDAIDMRSRSLRLKGDDSWITTPLNVAVVKPSEDVLMASNRGIDLYNYHDAAVHGGPGDTDIDKQPLRPVRELLSKYNKEN